MMKALRFTMVMLAATLVGVVAAGAQDKVDVTGTWLLSVTTDAGGTTTPSVTLEQDGEKLTGHYSSETLGEADVTGTLKGSAITFSLSVDGGGVAVDVMYAGTVEGNDAMKGTISIPGVAEGTFSGKREQ